MNNKKNAVSSLLLQGIIIVQGVVLPRLILGTFGSSVNGLISSITQFLSFISLLEGGLGAVVLAELYLPIEVQDSQKIKYILIECQKFFDMLAIVFVIYTIILSVVYPLFITKAFSFEYVFTLVYILSLTTLAQYLFSITYKLYLQADQKLYIVNYISIITIGLNLLLSIIVIFVFPNVHVLKGISGLIYLIQPIFFKHFIEEKYRLPKGIGILKEKIPSGVLKNKWSGFSQNLAHFINMNTDVALITIFCALNDVSVYTVYLLAINALRSIISSVENSYQSALGKYIAEGNHSKLGNKFEKIDSIFCFISTVCFMTCLLLINAFVGIYTTGIKDANYYQPIFAWIIVVANLVYVLREPYRLLILAAGHFKETNFGSIAEAVLNLVISICLIKKYGLIGVAIGTLVAITYRMLYFVWYLKRNIINREYKKYFVEGFCVTCLLIVNSYVYFYMPIKINNLLMFVVYGIGSVCINAVAYTLIYCACMILLRICKKVVIKGKSN